MSDIPKPKIYYFEDAAPGAKAVMEPLVDFVERRQTMAGEMKKFGAEAEEAFRGSVQAIEKFLEDPTSPEAASTVRDRLRDNYIAAADKMALTLCAGEEALRRYEAYYLENAAEILYAAPDETAAQELLSKTIKARDALVDRMQELSKPEQSHDFVCDALKRLDGARQMEVSIARGLPLEQNISVRSKPLHFRRKAGMTP